MKLTTLLSLSLGLTVGVATAADAVYDAATGTGTVWANGVNEDGGWYDVNKSSLADGHVESNMCYAASAANLIAWWQNGEYGVSSDAPTDINDIWNTFVSNNLTADEGGDTLSAINWWVSGVYAPLNEDGTYAEKEDPIWDRYYSTYDELVPSSGAENIPDDEMLPMSYATTDGYYYDQYGLTQNDLAELLVDTWVFGESEELASEVDFVEMFNDGACLSLAIVSDTDELAHAITLWGAEYNDGELTALWLTDSDDFDEFADPYLFKVGVEFSDDEKKIYLNLDEDAYGTGVYIAGIYALDATVSENWAPVPEPTTATLSLLALAALASRRRRK